MSARNKLAALESVRGIAAFYVFLHHYAHFVLEESYPRFARLFVLGQPAVMVFFLMSGFVIQYSTDVPGESPGFNEYFIRRFRRIYPLFLIAMALAYAGQCVMQHQWLVPGMGDLLCNLFMLQDGGTKPGVWASPFMGNSPLWSLSYEWFFYMAFFPIFAGLRRAPWAQKYVVTTLSLLGYFAYFRLPNPIFLFLMYFVMWWAGVELAREYQATERVTFRKQAFQIGSIAALSLLWYFQVKAARAAGNSSPWEHPALEFRHFVTTLALLVGGLAWYRLGARGFSWLLGWGRHLAPVSYALYICHVPVIDFCKGVRLTGSPWLDFVWVCPATLGLAYWLERRLQPRINAGFGRWLPARRQAGAISPRLDLAPLGKTAQSLGTK
jgi:peptidoglycan/LPS O-acetylase OafA/YrhL